MSRKSPELEKKREMAAAKIKEVAPHADVLIGMLDEVKVDLILIALAGASLKASGE